MDTSTSFFFGEDTTAPIFVLDQTTVPPAAGAWTMNTILTIVLCVVIVVLVVAAVVALCCYCMVKRNKAKNGQTDSGQEVVYVDSTGQRTVRTPVTQQVVEIFRAKKGKKKPVTAPAASTSPLEHAQVSVLNHVKEGGQYDVSIANISQQAIIATATAQPEPQPVIDEPVPLPAPNPTPRPHPGTTIHTLGDEPVTPPPPPPPAPVREPENLGPAVYNVPVAACGNHGYTIQAAAFDIPEPTPAPMFMAAPHLPHLSHLPHLHHHQQAATVVPPVVSGQAATSLPVVSSQGVVSQPSLFVTPQSVQPIPAMVPAAVAQPLPYFAPPLPPPGQPQQYFAPPQPVPLPLGLAQQQASLPYSPPSLSFPTAVAAQPTYNAGPAFNALPSVYPVASEVAFTGQGQGYAVSLPNISVGGGNVNMGYTVHQ